VSVGRGVAQRIAKLAAEAERLARRQVLVVVLEVLTLLDRLAPPPGGTLLEGIGYARAIGGTPEHRQRALAAVQSDAPLPADVVVWRYRPGVSELILKALTLAEAAGFGARGDGKTGAIPGLMAWHADLHREAGHALPVPWLGITDTFTSHEQKTVPSWSRAWLGGLVTFRDDRHVAVLTVDGVELAAMRLLGVPDLGAAGAVRTEAVGLWCEEAAPALVLEAATGVTVDTWTLARTSQGSRVPSVSYPAVQTLNYPDADHWTWVRYVVRKHPGTGYVRINPGERATEEDRTAWREALDGRPDLQRRLLDGQPGVIAEGPQVAVGYSSDRHVSPRRLTASPNAPLLVGIDGGLTPSAVIGQYLGGGAALNVLASLCVERGGTRQLLEDYIRPWLASHASWALRERRALLLYIDPSLDVPDQSNLEASPTRVMQDVLGVVATLGPVEWPARRDPLLALLGKVNPMTGRPALQLDPEEASLLDRSLSGRWHYPVVRGQVSREAPVKNHPWSDVADALTYLIAGIAPTRATRDPRRVDRPREAKTRFNPFSWSKR
jgi:hypothetical protein